MSQYRFKTSLHLTFSGLDKESIVPVEFDYTVNWARDATFEEPAEGTTVGIRKITVIDSKGERYPAPDWLWAVVENDGELGDELVAEARNDNERAADEHADAMRSEVRL